MNGETDSREESCPFQFRGTFAVCQSLTAFIIAKARKIKKSYRAAAEVAALFYSRRHENARNSSPSDEIAPFIRSMANCINNAQNCEIRQISASGFICAHGRSSVF